MLDRGLTSGRLILPAPALMESYSVMTRLPSPHAIAVSDAGSLLHETFHQVPVNFRAGGGRTRSLLHRLEEKASREVGPTMDTFSVRPQGKCGCLYTFNEKDFLALDEPDIEIVRPSQA